MKKQKLFKLLAIVSVTSALTFPLVAGSCENKNKNENPDPILKEEPGKEEPGKEEPGKEEPGKEEPGKENTNTYSFLYNDGGNKINVEYYENENRILIPDAQEITAPMLKSIFNDLEKKFNLKQVSGFILECPNALTICYNYQHSAIIKKLILPKIENVVNNVDGDEISGEFKTLNGYLEDEKVIQNGILFKWNHASGDIEDSSVRKIIFFAFDNTNDITSISFPNVTFIDPNAFFMNEHKQTEPFPLIKVNKLVINGLLIKWNDASGDIVDNTITSIATNAFFNNEKIKSVSFPNVTTIGVNAFSGATNLTSINMPKLKNVDDSAFENTPKLTGKIVVDGKLIKWDDAAGNIIDYSITSIAEGVFANNQNITSVSFPNATSIGYGAFYGATNLTSINMPKLKNVGVSALENTPKLTGKIVVDGKLIKWDDASGDIVDNTITSITTNVFFDNQKITSVSFPNVTSIGFRVFYGATNLTSINMPKLKNVGNSAFENTPKLTGKIVVNGQLIKWSDASGEIADDTITSIDNRVFENNQNITSVSFPNVTSIGYGAFYGATNLTSINMPKLSEISFNAFSNTPKLMDKIVVNNKLIKWLGASGDITDETITSVADEAFENNQNITSVSFPNVTTIGVNAFSGATNLTSINMPKLKEAGYGAFDYTPKLSGKIVVNGQLIKWSDASGEIADDSITSIAEGVFANNQNITSVSFPNVTTIGANAFSGATNLTSINMPKLKEAGYGAFDYTPKLSGKIVVNGQLIKWSDASGEIADDSITSIAEGVFANNQNITSVSFPNVASIGTGAFEGASNLINVEIGKVNNLLGFLTPHSSPQWEFPFLKSVSFPNVTEIWKYAFAEAQNLETANFPNVTSIGYGAFENAVNLTSINMPRLKEGDLGAFHNTPKLKSKIVAAGKLIKWDGASGEIVDDSITSIASGVFKNNKKITSVSFPNVTKIEDDAFYMASNLKSANLNNVISLGKKVFKDNVNLTTIIAPKLKNVASDTFINTPLLASKIIADGKLIKWAGAKGDITDPDVTSIEYSVFENNKNITSVNFPNVTYIGPNAFSGASNLINIDFPKVTKIMRLAFANTPSLPDKLILNGTLVKWENASGDIVDNNIISIADSVFENNKNITSVSFPNAKIIGRSAFSGARNLTKLDLPAANEIMRSAFANTPGLPDKLVLNGNFLVKWEKASGDIVDNNIISIADSVFENNENITSVSFPNLRNIGSSAFVNTSQLHSIDLPNVETIMNAPFWRTPKLPEKIVLNGILAKWENASGYVVDNDITSICGFVFYKNRDIYSVLFPKVTEIGKGTFLNATNLREANLPSVINIGERAFSGDLDLTTVNLPKLQSIGYNAFENTPLLVEKPKIQK
ncbi:leucine-rich repeat protein [Mycoplasma sp. Z631]|uniref:leucine-rich repeat domain-containing protein n=1 Tax=Mycoplasma sp. Z631 TaxID=3401685 RepID=UPI003AAC94F9